jgi:hypothetical protein
MSESKQNNTPQKKTAASGGKSLSRRNFLKYAGASAIAATTFGLASCNNNNPENTGNKLMISGINPNMAPPGTKVTIKGMNFSSTSSDDMVMFGSKKATVVSASTTKLVVKVPDGLEMGQKYTVKVSVNGHTATASTKFTVSKEKGQTVDLGSGNIGILNFAYALEQLEAAFYAKATGNMYSGASDNEKTILNDIAKHEKAHMKFFQKALGNNAIPGLTPDFSKIDFSDKSSVIGTAQVFENLGVQAYNSQGTYIDTSKKNGGTYLLIAGKIVSVEARHAAAVLNMDISTPSGDFANSKEVNDNGLEKTVSGSSEVLQAVAPYIKETIDGSNLPDQQ